MTTKNLIPRASGEGGIGITDVTWGYGYYDTGNFNKGLFVKGSGIEDVIANTVTQGGLGGEWTRNGLDIYYNGGNVGIGTTNPETTLHLTSSSADLYVNYASAMFGGTANSEIGLSYTNKLHIGSVNTSNNPQITATFERDGNVGIGTTSPAAKLDVNSASGDATLLVRNNTQTLRFDQNSMRGTTNNDLSIFTNGNEGQIYLKQTNGNVGIGTTTPGAKLDVLHFSNTEVASRFNNAGGSSPAVVHIIEDEISANHVGLFVGASDLSSAVLMTKQSNVGIGTTDPTADLHINSKATVTAADTSVSALRLQNGDSFNNSVLINARTDDTTSGVTDYTDRVGVMIATKGDERMRITSAGDVGIGTPNPEAKLHVIKLGTPSMINTEGINMTGNGWAAYTNSASDQNGTLRSATIGVYRPTTGDNLSGVVGLTSRNGSGHYIWSDDSGNLRTSTNSFEIGGTAGIVVGTQTSDERLKNIESDFEYGLEQVMQLQPIAYILKDDQDEIRRLGFGAQTTQGIIPEVVYDTRECVDGYDTDPEDEHKKIARSEQNKLAMKYVELVPVLTKAIQEQQQLIEDLRSEVETLNNK